MSTITESARQKIKVLWRLLPILAVLVGLLLTPVFLAADDGEMFRKNVSKTPDEETEHAALKMLPVYVPAQASDGTLLDGIEYYDADGALVETREYAQPLIAMYTDGYVEYIDEEAYGGFPGHGERDAFAAVSLDDGATWKRSNLSNSADLSSFTIRDGRKSVPYPGDVGRAALASDGNQVLAVWASRYASGGSPNYAMSDSEREAVATYMGMDVTACTDGDLIDTPCLYMEDHFAVAGAQGSSDLADEGFPLIGELPYAALWAARGVVLPPAAEGEASTIVWFKAERLSSAVRDANRPEASCVKGAGCVVTWQEDPGGIRPGEGEGPGEGWSGAIAHHQTDTWYSYIDWDDFSLVSADGTYGTLLNDTGSLADWVVDNPTGTPQAAIPMAIPVRLTDNAMCVAEGDKPYCYADFDGSGTPDFCASSVSVTIETPEGPTQEVDMCVTEDGRLMRGNTASTRARLGLHGYSSLGDYREDPSAYPIDSAWFTVSYEESKGLGECDDVEDPFKIDMGKNVWYHTFDMFTPELVSQGLMLNQPAIYPEDFVGESGVLGQDTSLGYNFYTINDDPVYFPANIETTLYQTEISRRPSPITQDWYDAGTSGMVALQLWKQGIIRRGGPADIMGRRFVIPEEFDPAADNPYDYQNMACETWAFEDGSNPRYVKGFCADPAVNLSGNTVLAGEDGICTDAEGCLELFPFNDYFDDLDMSNATGGISKIWEWRQYGPNYDGTLVGDENSPEDGTNLNDTSWENPYDVAKGHRGFMAGDMILAMYAWSPNWQANTVGHDNYNLYTRRSFDGGQTWTTLPASFEHTDGITYSGDGTTTCEWMGQAGSDTEYSVCTDYAAGEFEQARNLSQLVGNRETILDPRYSPTTRSVTEASVSTGSLPGGFVAPLYDDDTRDPSRFFMVYETGDNTTVAVGEAEPLDLFYSRAIDWGDDYLVWQDEAIADCLPAADDEALAGFCNEFDALEGSDRSESGEASITSSPGGELFYAVWNQVDFDRKGHETGSDAWFRRVLFLDDYVPGDDGDGGGSGPEDPPGPRDLPREFVEATADLGLEVETVDDLTPTAMDLVVTYIPQSLDLLSMENWEALAPESLVMVTDEALVYVDDEIAGAVTELVGKAKSQIGEAPGFGPESDAGPGWLVTPLMAEQTIPAGTLSVWNTKDKMILQIEPDLPWRINSIQIYVGAEPVPTNKGGNPKLGDFPYKETFSQPVRKHTLVLNLEEDLDFRWGSPYEDLRLQNIAVHAELVELDAPSTARDGAGEPRVIDSAGVWAFGPNEFVKGRWGWWTTHTLAHPANGHFIDSPVAGLTVRSPTYNGRTDDSGSFEYLPGQTVDLNVGWINLGTAIADQKISPLDLFEQSDTDDVRVINMARLLQSLDVDGSPKQGISITNEVLVCLNQTMMDMGLPEVSFADDGQIDALIDGTIGYCADVEGVNLVSVSAEDAKANLDRSLDSTMLRKNLSRTPELTSSKSKFNIMGVWFPALKANGDPTVVEYYDDTGALINTAEEAKPLVAVFTDAVEETGAEDIWAAISRDDGNTWKRKDLSRTADRTSFTLANGEEYFGDAKKPVFQVKGNKILVAWTSKYCKGGKPAYAIDTEDDYTYDDPYYTGDIWGVAGPQRSVDYAEMGYPEVGEVPYSCVWTARGTIVTQGMINSSAYWAQYVVGDIVWFKPERLTSGRRDANQVFMGASDGAGFAIAWQEDPEGLRPGSAAGPGPGWGGATTNHKTDIWYSYITWDDFGKVDTHFVSGGDPEHELDVLERPKALVPMSLPVRVSDNDVVNSDNIMATTEDFGTWTPVANPNTDGDGDGTHAYGYAIDGLCEAWYEKVNEQGETKQVCITADNRLLDGDTGASRPNLFLQTYTKPDGTKSAWAIFAYEETKGVGGGSPDHEPDGGPYGDDYLAESGKNAIYHSFDFQNPDLVSAGNIINLPEKEVDADGNIISNISYIQDEEGNLILDWLEQPQINYENARRPRFILQGKSAAGDSGTVLLVLYKEGQEGMGRPSDIMLRRVVSLTPGNPYAFKNFVCDATEVADNGVTVCVDGAQNMSSVTPTVTTDSMGDPTSEDPYGAVKVVEWVQTVDNLADLSSANPYDDARAHRGAIRGDFVVMGFSYTPNWAAARNGNDKYDLYVRRSFDGGQTWTTDPSPMDPSAVYETCNTWTYPSGTESAGTKVEVCNTYAPGEFEQMRNVSQLPNNKTSVIEPRIVGTPGTIKVDGVWTGIDEDKQDKNVFYVSYGTSTNPKKDPVTGEQEAPVPMDLYYSFSTDRGESYVEVAWEVNPDSDGNYAGETVYRWDYLAKGDAEQGEAQLRMTPDGSRFYATWLEEGEEGSDIWFRRIMSPAFPANVAGDRVTLTSTP